MNDLDFSLDFYKVFKESLTDLSYIREEDINNLMDNTKKIIGKSSLNSPNPFSNILAIGEVQSGKTNNIFSVASAAIDNGFDIIIILGGVTNILFTQTVDRMNEIFDSNVNQESIFITGKDLAERNSEFALNQIVKRRKVILSVLKDYSTLKLIYQQLEFCNLASKKMFIIDDEADYASINIKRKGNKSAIYRLISGMYTFADNCTYLAVTATPYANMFNKSSDKLYPDYILELKQSKNYTGLSFFDDLKEKTYVITEPLYPNELNWRDLVNQSVIYFLFCSAIKKEILPDNEELLINIDSKKPSHDVVIRYVIDFLKSMRSFSIHILSNGYWKKAYHDYEEIIVEYNISKHKIMTNVMSIVNSIVANKSVVLLNSDNLDRSKFKSGGFPYTIICGGYMISRGFTFSKLLVELIINAPVSSKISADTMLQRARWFGYRNLKSDPKKLSRVNFMRILMSKSIYDAYEESLSLQKECSVLINSIDWSIKNNLQEYFTTNMKKYNYISPTSTTKSR